MVIKYTGEDLYKSTYHSLYAKNPDDYPRATERIQKRRLFQQSSVDDDDSNIFGKTNLNKRPFRLNRDIPLCLGLGSFTDAPMQSAYKEIVSSGWPQRSRWGNDQSKSKVQVTLKFPPQNKAELDEIAKRLIWLSSTKRQQDEGCLPIPNRVIPRTAWEPNADVVRYRPRRHQASCIRHTCAPAWDKAQLRPVLHRSGEFRPKDTRSRQRKVEIPDTTPGSESYENVVRYRESSDFSIIDQSRLRRLPGYAGFVPREPIERNKDSDKRGSFQYSASNPDFIGHQASCSDGPYSTTTLKAINPLHDKRASMRTSLQTIFY